MDLRAAARSERCDENSVSGDLGLGSVVAWGLGQQRLGKGRWVGKELKEERKKKNEREKEEKSWNEHRDKKGEEDIGKDIWVKWKYYLIRWWNKIIIFGYIFEL